MLGRIAKGFRDVSTLFDAQMRVRARLHRGAAADVYRADIERLVFGHVLALDVKQGMSAT
jgi:hypothetical protein